jgi:hypothetical protein
VLGVDTQDAFEVAAVEDQPPVEALDTNGSDKPLGDGACLRRPTGVVTIRMAPPRNTSSKGPLYLRSRSRIQEPDAPLGEVEAELRACSVAQAPVGLVEQPASQTRRVAWAMKNRAS